METKILKITNLSHDSDKIEYAAEVLKSGGLVALPTETVYGIAANALDTHAVKKIFIAKGRPQDNPLIVHVSDYNEVKHAVKSFPESARLLAENFWPGPLTMVLERGGNIPDIVSAGLDTVAIRMPSHPVMRAVIKKSGLMLAAPSANLSGSPSPTTAKHCIDDLTGRVDLILDGGECDVGLESTVVSMVQSPPRLLRPGAVTLEALQDILGEVTCDNAILSQIQDFEKVSSPGMKYRHYAPKTKLTMVCGDFNGFLEYSANFKDFAALVFDGEDKFLSLPCVCYGKENDAAGQARNLFSSLRQIDSLNVPGALVRAPDKTGLGLAVYNRLLRACGFNVVNL